MVTFNLLPWRQHKMLQQMRRANSIMLILIILTVILLSISHLLLAHREKVLHLQVSRLKQKIEKASLLELMQKQTSVSQHQPTKKNLFEDAITRKLFLAVSRPASNNVCFTQMTKVKNGISFAGNARSIIDLTTYLRYWQAAYLFSEIRIEKIYQDKNHLIKFHLFALENKNSLLEVKHVL